MKVLFFSPFADVWPHSLPEALVAEMCLQESCEVTVVRCRGLLSQWCVAMTAAGLDASASPKDREKICRSCRQTSALLDSEFRFTSRFLEDYLTPADHLEVERIIQSVTPENWHEFQVENIPIGRLAAYEFYLVYKLNSFEIPETLWLHYVGQLRNSLAVLLASKKFLGEVQPERVIVYNALYSVNHVVMHVAEQLGIAALAIHGGFNVERILETLIVSRNARSILASSRSESWFAQRGLPIDARSIEEVSTYVKFLLRGTGAFVYSSAYGLNSVQDLRRRFGVTDDQKVLLCATSSGDELFAARMVGALPPIVRDNSMFGDQVEWLQYVIGMARRHPEWCVIIRVHPREFPNRRERQLSQNAIALTEVLSDLPTNVKVNWPDQAVSLYDLAQITDVLLNGSSSVGAEFALLGIPVVVHDPENLFNYPRGLNYSAASLLEYELVIAQALSAGWSFEHVRNAFRWKAFQFQRLCVDLGSAIPSWSAKSPLRVLRGMRYKWKWPIPVALILMVERFRVRRRPARIEHAHVIVDTIRHARETLGESSVWPSDARASEEEERVALLAALSDFHDVFATNDATQDCLGSRMASFLSRSTL